jgi:hypothetical protein
MNKRVYHLAVWTCARILLGYSGPMAYRAAMGGFGGGEMKRSAASWEHDFDVTYTKVQ